MWLLGVSGKTKQEVRAKLQALHQELNSGVNLDHFEGLTRCLGALSALALERDDPHLAARLIGTAAAVRDRFGFKPWPYVTQAERPAIQRAAALLPTASTPRNWPPAAARPSTTHSPQPCRSCKTGRRPRAVDPHRRNRPSISTLSSEPAHRT